MGPAGAWLAHSWLTVAWKAATHASVFPQRKLSDPSADRASPCAGSAQQDAGREDDVGPTGVWLAHTHLAVVLEAATHAPEPTENSNSTADRALHRAGSAQQDAGREDVGPAGVWLAHTHLAVALEAATHAPEPTPGQPIPLGQDLYLNPSPLLGACCTGEPL